MVRTAHSCSKWSCRTEKRTLPELSDNVRQFEELRWQKHWRVRMYKTVKLICVDVFGFDQKHWSCFTESFTWLTVINSLCLQTWHHDIYTKQKNLTQHVQSMNTLFTSFIESINQSAVLGWVELDPIPALTGREAVSPWTGCQLITGLTHTETNTPIKLMQYNTQNKGAATSSLWHEQPVMAVSIKEKRMTFCVS